MGTNDEIDLRALGSRIVELRASRGWKQTELGRRTGIAAPRLSRIEHGHSAPTLSELARMGTAFETGLDLIVFGSPAAELKPLEMRGGIATLELLLHYLVRGYQAEHGEAPC
jgi:transcriptional regulator with XRE-family HTH domain